MLNSDDVGQLSCLHLTGAEVRLEPGSTHSAASFPPPSSSSRRARKAASIREENAEKELSYYCAVDHDVHATTNLSERSTSISRSINARMENTNGRVFLDGHHHDDHIRDHHPECMRGDKGSSSSSSVSLLPIPSCHQQQRSNPQHKPQAVHGQSGPDGRLQLGADTADVLVLGLGVGVRVGVGGVESSPVRGGGQVISASNSGRRRRYDSKARDDEEERGSRKRSSSLLLFSVRDEGAIDKILIRSQAVEAEESEEEEEGEIAEGIREGEHIAKGNDDDDEKKAPQPSPPPPPLIVINAREKATPMGAGGAVVVEGLGLGTTRFERNTNAAGDTNTTKLSSSGGGKGPFIGGGLAAVAGESNAEKKRKRREAIFAKKISNAMKLFGQESVDGLLALLTRYEREIDEACLIRLKKEEAEERKSGTAQVIAAQVHTSYWSHVAHLQLVHFREYIHMCDKRQSSHSGQADYSDDCYHYQEDDRHHHQQRLQGMGGRDGVKGRDLSRVSSSSLEINNIPNSDPSGKNTTNNNSDTNGSRAQSTIPPNVGGGPTPDSAAKTADGSNATRIKRDIVRQENKNAVENSRLQLPPSSSAVAASSPSTRRVSFAIVNVSKSRKEEDEYDAPLTNSGKGETNQSQEGTRSEATTAAAAAALSKAKPCIPLPLEPSSLAVKRGGTVAAADAKSGSGRKEDYEDEVKGNDARRGEYTFDPFPLSPTTKKGGHQCEKRYQHQNQQKRRLSQILNLSPVECHKNTVTKSNTNVGVGVDVHDGHDDHGVSNQSPSHSYSYSYSYSSFSPHHFPIVDLPLPSLRTKKSRDVTGKGEEEGEEERKKHSSEEVLFTIKRDAPAAFAANSGSDSQSESDDGEASKNTTADSNYNNNINNDNDTNSHKDAENRSTNKSSHKSKSKSHHSHRHSLPPLAVLAIALFPVGGSIADLCKQVLEALDLRNELDACYSSSESPQDVDIAKNSFVGAEGACEEVPMPLMNKSVALLIHDRKEEEEEEASGTNIAHEGGRLVEETLTCRTTRTEEDGPFFKDAFEVPATEVVARGRTMSSNPPNAPTEDKNDGFFVAKENGSAEHVIPRGQDGRPPREPPGIMDSAAHFLRESSYSRVLSSNCSSFSSPTSSNFIGLKNTPREPKKEKEKGKGDDGQGSAIHHHRYAHNNKNSSAPRAPHRPQQFISVRSDWWKSLLPRGAVFSAKGLEVQEGGAVHSGPSVVPSVALVSPTATSYSRQPFLPFLFLTEEERAQAFHSIDPAVAEKALAILKRGLVRTRRIKTLEAVLKAPTNQPFSVRQLPSWKLALQRAAEQKAAEEVLRVRKLEERSYFSTLPFVNDDYAETAYVVPPAPSSPKMASATTKPMRGANDLKSEDVEIVAAGEESLNANASISNTSTKSDNTSSIQSFDHTPTMSLAYYLGNQEYEDPRGDDDRPEEEEEENESKRPKGVPLNLTTRGGKEGHVDLFLDGAGQGDDSTSVIVDNSYNKVVVVTIPPENDDGDCDDKGEEEKEAATVTRRWNDTDDDEGESLVKKSSEDRPLSASNSDKDAIPVGDATRVDSNRDGLGSDGLNAVLSSPSSSSSSTPHDTSDSSLLPSSTRGRHAAHVQMVKRHRPEYYAKLQERHELISALLDRFMPLLTFIASMIQLVYTILLLFEIGWGRMLSTDDLVGEWLVLDLPMILFVFFMGIVPRKVKGVYKFDDSIYESLRRYTKSTFFWLDCAGALPLDLLIGMHVGPFCMPLTNNCKGIVAPYWRLNRLLLSRYAFWNLGDLIEDISTTRGWFSPIVGRIFLMIVYVFTVAHIDACILNMILDAYPEQASWWKGDPKYFYRTDTDKYFQCLDWSTKTFASLWQGENFDLPTGIIIFVLISTMIGIIMFASMIGAISTFLDTPTNYSILVQKIEVMHEKWKVHHTINEELYLEAREYLWHLFKTNGGKSDLRIVNTLDSSSLAKPLQVKLLTQLGRDILMKVPLLQNEVRNDQFVRALSVALNPMILPPFTVFCKKGDVGDSMAFITFGIMGVVPSNFVDTKDESSALFILRPGSFFGEIALILGVARTATVSSLSRFANLLVLQKEVFDVIGQDFPHIVSRLRLEAEARLTLGANANPEALNALRTQKLLEAIHLSGMRFYFAQWTKFVKMRAKKRRRMIMTMAAAADDEVDWSRRRATFFNLEEGEEVGGQGVGAGDDHDDRMQAGVAGLLTSDTFQKEQDGPRMRRRAQRGAACVRASNRGSDNEDREDREENESRGPREEANEGMLVAAFFESEDDDEEHTLKEELNKDEEELFDDWRPSHPSYDPTDAFSSKSNNDTNDNTGSTMRVDLRSAAFVRPASAYVSAPLVFEDEIK